MRLLLPLFVVILSVFTLINTSPVPNTKTALAEITSNDQGVSKFIGPKQLTKLESRAARRKKRKQQKRRNRRKHNYKDKSRNKRKNRGCKGKKNGKKCGNKVRKNRRRRRKCRKGKKCKGRGRRRKKTPCTSDADCKLGTVCVVRIKKKNRKFSYSRMMMNDAADSSTRSSRGKCKNKKKYNRNKFVTIAPPISTTERF